MTDVDWSFSLYLVYERSFRVAVAQVDVSEIDQYSN